MLPTILERARHRVPECRRRARGIGSAGAEVNEETGLVWLPRDLVSLGLCARRQQTSCCMPAIPRAHLHVGGNVVNFGPVNGAPNVTDLERGRRYGDIAAFRDLLKLTHAFGILHWQGGIVVEPVDLPVPTRHLAIYQAHSSAPTSSGPHAAWRRAGRGRHRHVGASSMAHVGGAGVAPDADDGDQRQLAAPGRCRKFSTASWSWPRPGQCVVITPFTLMGAMAPITLAGRLVQQTAEAWRSIACARLIRPGAPCVLGGFTSNVDMRTGSPAFGTPEYVNAVLAGAQIGRRLKFRCAPAR